jgi:hypothetical protein
MAELQVEGEDLVVHLARMERIAAFRGDVRVPLLAAMDIRYADDPWAELRGVPAPGIDIPRLIALGTRRGRGIKDFAAVYAGKQGIVIELKRAPFTRLVVSARDSYGVLERVANARNNLPPRPPSTRAQIPAGTWTHLIELSSTGGSWLGRTANGHWVVGKPAGSGYVVTGAEPWLWPLLELTYEAQADALRAAARGVQDSPEELVDSLPITTILATALMSGQDYWASLALGWLEANSTLPRPRKELRALATSGKATPQTIRHRAKSLLGARR